MSKMTLKVSLSTNRSYRCDCAKVMYKSKGKTNYFFNNDLCLTQLY